MARSLQLSGRLSICVALIVAVSTILELCAATEDASSSSADTSCPEVCGLAPDGGPCLKRKRFRMWYFDFDAGECRKFSYGGCKGNKNRFWTSQECEAMCGKCKDQNLLPVDTPTDYCELPQDQGKCESPNVLPTIKWHFNVELNKCEPFAYTGCGGNANRFDTQQYCEHMCHALHDTGADDLI